LPAALLPPHTATPPASPGAFLSGRIPTWADRVFTEETRHLFHRRPLCRPPSTPHSNSWADTRKKAGRADDATSRGRYRHILSLVHSSALPHSGARSTSLHCFDGLNNNHTLYSAPACRTEDAHPAPGTGARRRYSTAPPSSWDGTKQPLCSGVRDSMPSRADSSRRLRDVT